MKLSIKYKSCLFFIRGLFPDLLRSMGIYSDPAHPALTKFPTREYAGWQWYDLLTEAWALTLNDLPFEYEPVVYMIDDFNPRQTLTMKQLDGMFRSRED